MRAAFLTGRQTLAVGEVDLPPPGPGQVLLDVAACGVCGSNLHDWHRGAAAAAAADVPGAFGHEVGGIVAALGPDVHGVAVGDVVAVEPSAARGCGTCSACRDGASWFCAQPRPVPAYGFAERMVIPAAATFPVPAGLDAVAAALAEPLACGVHAVRHSWTAGAEGRVDGRTVVVLGAGMLGLAAAAAARALGAADVVVVARHPHQAAAAHAVGADRVLDDGAEGLARTLRRLRPGLVVEAVGGRAATLALAMEVVAWRGEVVVLGSFEEPQTIDAGRAVAREVRLFFAVSYAARGGVHDYDVALQLLGSGAVPVDGLVTHRFALDDVDAAFAVAADKRSGALRVMVCPT